MKKHILLIDDERAGLQIFINALNATGLSYKCTYAGDYQHALQMLEYLVPDFIFLDMDIPGTRWQDCLRAMQRNPQIRNIPTVLYSDRLNIRLMEEAYKAGAEFCIHKTTGSESLSSILADVLQTEHIR